ncbi:YcxB family protein [Xanthocytophaga agilis]|uniref:YcxB family protein n=1 Tax=Xanthocytophaga agilis TaxID=3048010 RepID=A0AAE3UGT8_9BACT|nr:YcxB family protein [Xanthocytophaga agilis]MDJ1503641.1 YcxB family protein [Xanthocytophaga agilis]
MPIELPLKIHIKFVPDQIRAIYQIGWDKGIQLFNKIHSVYAVIFKLFFGLTSILFLLSFFYPVCLQIGMLTLILGMCVYIPHYNAKRKILSAQSPKKKAVEDWIAHKSKVKSYILEIDDLQVTLYEDTVPHIFPWSTFQQYLISETFIILSDTHLNESQSLLLPKAGMTAEEYRLLSEIIEQKMEDKTRLTMSS